MNKLIYLVFGVLLIGVAWLVWRDLKPSNGLECVYNCESYNQALESLK